MLKRRPVDWAGCVAQSRIDFEKYYNHKVATKWESAGTEYQKPLYKMAGNQCRFLFLFEWGGGNMGDLVWVRIFFPKPLVIDFFFP